MELTLQFSEINWLSVIIATLVAFGIGGIWYSAFLFWKAWQKELNLSYETLKNANMAVINLTLMLPRSYTWVN